MGMLVVGAGLMTLLVTGLLGLAGFLTHFYFWAKKRRGSWWLFFGITIVVALAIGALGWEIFNSQTGIEHSGAPTTEQYEAALFGAIIMCAAPGLGLVAGVLAVLKRASTR